MKRLLCSSSPMPLLIAAFTLLLAVQTSRGVDELKVQEYLGKLEEQYTKEYRTCTGDDSCSDVRKVVTWRRWIARQVSTMNYPAVLGAYLRAHPQDSSTVPPCRVLEWRMEQQKMDPSDKPPEPEVIPDSIRIRRVARDLSLHAPSPFDFEGIPFGVTRATLTYILTKDLELHVASTAYRLEVSGYVLGGRPLTLTFYMDSTHVYYRYDLSSTPFPADSLDLNIHGTAVVLGDSLTVYAGQPTRAFRVGLFDIKKNKLAALRVWKAQNHLAVVGILREGRLYHTRAIVTDRQERRTAHALPAIHYVRY